MYALPPGGGELSLRHPALLRAGDGQSKGKVEADGIDPLPLVKKGVA